MASQMPKALDCQVVIKELEKTCDLTTQLQQEIASMLKNSADSEVGMMFEELLRALRTSVNLLCNREVTTNDGFQGSVPKRREADDYQEEEHDSSMNIYKEVYTPEPNDDGYQWRKYGRKKILNNLYPRDYYRCIHSNNNCKAKKQVQRHCNRDPSLYKVIYIHNHNHTCNTSIHNSQQVLGLSAKETPPPRLSLNSSVFRHEEEHAALVSCLQNIIGGSSRNQQMPNGESPNGYDNIVSQPMETSCAGLAPSSHAWEMDHDMVLMDLSWPESEMDLF